MDQITSLFAGLSLDKDSPVPAYFQIKDYIERLIAERRLRSGDKLPSERDFCDAFPISRMTYRQALTTLKQKGLLVQQQGRGTFVGSPKVGLQPMDVLSFSEALHGQGLAPSARTLKKKLLDPTPPEVAAELGLAANGTALSLVRMRQVDDVPVVVESSWLDAERFGALMHTNLTDRSLYRILEEKFQTRIARRREIVEATAADERLAKMLLVDLNSPVVRITGYNYGEDGRLVEYVISHYRGDRARFIYETKVR